MDIYLAKAAGGALVPIDQQSVEAIAKLKLGQGVKVSIKRVRNLGHHRKMMALLNLAFEAWEPDALEYKGEKVLKNFDQFRNDVIVLAGYGEATFNLRGEMRVRAKSMSFANMSQDEFDGLYQAVVTVVLGKVLKNYKGDDLENVINQVLSFT